VREITFGRARWTWSIFNKKYKNDFDTSAFKGCFSAHTAAFKLGGLFDILALFSISRVNL